MVELHLSQYEFWISLLTGGADDDLGSGVPGLFVPDHILLPRTILE